MLARFCFVDFHSWIPLEKALYKQGVRRVAYPVYHGWKHRQRVPAEQTHRAVLQVTFTAMALSRNTQFPSKNERCGCTE